MGQIVVRQLDDKVLEAVKSRAAANKRSTEAEVRAILASAVGLSGTVNAGASDSPKRFSDFVGIATKRSTQEEIDAYVRSLRDEWER